MKRPRATVIFVLAGLLSGPTWGSNLYEVRYEGNVLPEQEPGWYRVHYADPLWGGAIRTIETDPEDPNNKFLVINTLASPMILDYARYPRQMDPDGPLEVFRSEWRILIAQGYGVEEQSVGFISDNDNIVSFSYG